MFSSPTIVLKYLIILKRPAYKCKQLYLFSHWFRNWDSCVQINVMWKHYWSKLYTLLQVLMATIPDLKHSCFTPKQSNLQEHISVFLGYCFILTYSKALVWFFLGVFSKTLVVDCVVFYQAVPCVESFRIRSYSGPLFPHSDQNYSECGHFSRTGYGTLCLAG